jgi:3-phenylpropionate/trans-cinnamate dioxygenase ferredoxin component
MTMNNWVKVARKSDIGSAGLDINVGGEEILLIKDGDEILALSNICSHQEKELAGGLIEDNAWVCPHHGARFELRTGKALSMPAVEDIRSYSVKCEGDEVFIEEK